MSFLQGQEKMWATKEISAVAECMTCERRGFVCQWQRHEGCRACGHHVTDLQLRSNCSYSINNTKLEIVLNLYQLPSPALSPLGSVYRSELTPHLGLRLAYQGCQAGSTVCADLQTRRDTNYYTCLGSRAHAQEKVVASVARGLEAWERALEALHRGYRRSNGQSGSWSTVGAGLEAGSWSYICSMLDCISTRWRRP